MTVSRFAAGLYIYGALSALVSVSLAALASHGLAGLAPAGEQAVEWFRIATDFQMNHALGLILVTAISEHLIPGHARTMMRMAAGFLAAGALLFPAALYSLSFLGPSFFAPFGGVAAMVGWALFAVAGLSTLRRQAKE